MIRRLVILGLAAALLAGVAPAMAQAPQAPAMSRPLEIEGTVSKVNPVAGTIGISWGWFGLLGRTLEVTPDTRIQVQGQPATLADIKEGEKVKAAYEPRQGKSVATSIELSPTGAKP